MTDTNTSGAPTMTAAKAVRAMDEVATRRVVADHQSKGEVSELTRDFQAAIGVFTALIERGAALTAERDALAAEVKALREDAERLSWHEADMAKADEGVGIEYDETSGKFRFPYLYNGAGGFGGGVCHANYDTLRAAIDAARASAATGGGNG